MKSKYNIWILVLSGCFLACQPDKEVNVKKEIKKPAIEMVFDEEKWKTKEGMDYPYRDMMLHDVVYNDTIRTLSEGDIVRLLGEPDSWNNNHFYYYIFRKRIGFFALHTKTMVIKFKEDTTIEWIKIHE